MELSEAKEILKEFYKSTKIDDSKIRLALFSVMYYIENESISKEKIREKIKTIEDIPGLTTANEAQIEILEELLGE